VLARTIVESEEKCIDIRTALVFSEFENGKLQMQLHLHFRQIYLEEIECALANYHYEGPKHQNVCEI